MSSKKVTFKNKEGHGLYGNLEMPLDQKPHNFALFAHCFTCNKNFFAVKNISDSLTAKGFGVLRFDFTGLGESEGEFADSNFSGNVEDLLAAAAYLKVEYKSPSLLIGHSLGGAAVLFAAQQLPDVTAIATIGAPSSVKHVQQLIEGDLDEITSNGMARVNIGGRPFNIKKQFLDDLKKQELIKIVPGLDKSLLILHSPQDSIVEIKNAEELYKAAKHPKSFVSLDGADHLLSNREDSLYAGEIIGSWAHRYLEIPKVSSLKTKHDVVAFLGDEGLTTQIKAGNHYFVADEPEEVGGNNFGPNPYELVSAGLAACTSMTVQMYAKRKGWILEQVETHVNYSKEHAIDSQNCEDDSAKIDTFKRDLRIKSNLDEKQIHRLLEIASKCPVHKTLHSPTQIITSLKKER
ncbi:MAG TPA: bifunctional alpha/beta hydrolase/OsmC family protein [Gillisia sp.]|nr:bifunctional alpha/beta hydrolase/OsmC family protein [Gillisia sp.]